MDLSKMSVLSQLSVDELRDLAYGEHPDVRWDMVTSVLLDRAAKQQADNDELATRLRAAEAWRAEVDAWLVNWLMVASDDPKESVQRLVQAEVQVALDPAVSELAAELRDTYKARAEAAEARALMAESRPCVEICQANRDAGRGPCGACALCCKEQRERAEAAEKQLADIDRALYPERDPYGEGDSLRADAMWDIHKIRQAARTPTPTPATGQETTR